MSLVVMVDSSARAQERAHWVKLCRDSRRSLPVDGQSSHAISINGGSFIWQQHSEFSTYTLFVPGAFSEPFADLFYNRIPDAWLEAIPGKVLRRVKLALYAKGQAEAAQRAVEQYFTPVNRVSSVVQGGGAQIWTNFKIHRDNFGHMLVLMNGSGRGSTGRLVQQLLEMGHYRKLTLLGLPVAHQARGLMDEVEDQLASIVEQLKDNQIGHDQALNQLVSITVEAEMISSLIDSRLAATKAYYQLTCDRLRELREERVEGEMTLADFTARRLKPSFRTCESVSERHRDLCRRLERVYSLLQIKTSTTMAKQSRDLLSSMDQRVALQVKMQRLVESVSVIVISYHVVALINAELDSLYQQQWIPDPSAVHGLLIPIVLLGSWGILRRIYRKAG